MEATYSPRYGIRNRWFRLVAVAGIVAAALVIFALVRRSGGHASASASKLHEVARQAGASECTDSGYEFISRLDSSHERVFNCMIGDRLRCVTYDHGIARDETDTARLLFADQLNKQVAPVCGQPALNP